MAGPEAGTLTRGTDERGTLPRGLGERGGRSADADVASDEIADSLRPDLAAPPADPELDVSVGPAGVQFALPEAISVLLDGPGLGTDPGFAYEYFPAIPARPYPILRLVVAPGVALHVAARPLEGQPQRLVREGIRALLGPKVEIIRVQAASNVPRRGDPIASTDYLGVPADVLERGRAASEQVVPYRRVDGIDLMHTSNGDTLRIRVPIESATARFAYDVRPPEADRGWSIIRVVKTPAVDVTLYSRAPNLLDPEIHVYEVPSVSDVPEPGTPWSNPPNELGRIPLIKYHLPQTPGEILAFAAVDLLIGALPGVGNLVTLAELVNGVLTGEDKWGRPLTNVDLVVLGVSVGLPFLAKGPAALARFVGRSTSESTIILAGLRRVDEERRLLMFIEAADAIRAGKALPVQDAGELTRAVESFAKGAEAVAPEARAVGRAAEKLAPAAAEGVAAVGHAARPSAAPARTVLRTIDDIITANGRAIVEANEDLRQVANSYRAYVARNREGFLPPDEWISHITRPGPLRSLLERVLGPNYARGLRSARDRLLRLSSIPRPERYQVVAEDLRRLFASAATRQQLFDRLGNLLAELQELPPGVVRKAHWRILKGNIGEALSRNLQQRVLAEIRLVEKDARLFGGITVELAGGTGDPVLFSDRIVASVRGGNLQIHAVIEVKSGFSGGQEATSQIFKWIEKHAEEDLRLTVPGVGTFVYDPRSRNVGRLVGLARAPRVIIAARGTERLGLRSAEQVAAPVRRYSVDRTPEELDYLTRRLIESIAPRPR